MTATSASRVISVSIKLNWFQINPLSLLIEKADSSFLTPVNNPLGHAVISIQEVPLFVRFAELVPQYTLVPSALHISKVLALPEVPPPVGDLIISEIYQAGGGVIVKGSAQDQISTFPLVGLVVVSPAINLPVA